MNLPTPPTDNLYKFVALSGLVMVLLSIVLPYSAHQRYQQQLLVTLRDASLLSAELDKLVMWQVQIDSGTYNAVHEGRFFPEIRRKHPYIVDGAWDSAGATRIKGTFDKEVERRGGPLAYLIDLETKQIRVEHENRLANHLNSELRFLRKAAVIGTGIGLTLSMIGFSLWYSRLQVHQDRAVRQQKGEPSA